MYHESGMTLSESFKRGDISAEAIITHYFERIAQYDPQIGAFLSLTQGEAFSQARALDEKRKQGLPVGAMAAIPVAVKDNINVKGTFTTCGSRFLENYRSPYDATVIQKLKQQDAIIIGKTNLDEFAMGSSTENSALKITRNPWNLACSPGGSSGGSCAAVAARLAPIALGSDTGGSIRQPASLTGVVGFKPTYGYVSRHGLVAFGSSLDQIGPIATCAEDAALAVDVMGGHCPHDSTSLPLQHAPVFPTLRNSIAGTKIGVPWHFLENLDTETKQVFERSVEALRELGAEVIEVDLSILKYSIAVYYILATAEASTNLSRFDGIRYGKQAQDAKTLEELYALSRQQGFGDEVKRRIMLGTFVLSAGYQDAYYKKAQKVRRLIIDAYHTAFKQCDLVATPVSPCAAFELGSIKDPLQMYLADIYTIGANLAGLPGLSVPAGFTHDMKPIGFQLMGPQLSDALVLRAGYQLEKKLNAASQIPPSVDTRSSL